MLTVLWVTSSGRAQQGWIILASQNPGASAGVVGAAGAVWASTTGVIYIWGLGKAVRWLLWFFFTRYLLGLPCPPRRCPHSHICLRGLERLAGGQHHSLHALSLWVLPAGKSQGDSSELQEWVLQETEAAGSVSLLVIIYSQKPQNVTSTAFSCSSKLLRPVLITGEIGIRLHPSTAKRKKKMTSCLVYYSRFLKDSELIFLLACHLLLILPINQDNQ